MVKKYANLNKVSEINNLTKQIAIVHKKSENTIKKVAFQQYKQLASKVASNAPRSDRTQRFSKKKGRVLVPLSAPTDGDGTTAKSGGFQVRRQYEKGHSDIWLMNLFHRDKNSLLHLVEFGTIGSAPRPFMMPTWRSNYKSIITDIDSKTMKKLRSLYGNDVVKVLKK